MVPYERYKSDASVFSGINIVPFTDIVLVLLIIFMIAAPGLITSGMNINLPGASTSDPEVPSRVTVSVDASGGLYLDGAELAEDQLAQEIASLVEQRADIGVVLNADRESTHGQVIQILDLLRSAGARRIYVGTVRR